MSKPVWPGLVRMDFVRSSLRTIYDQVGYKALADDLKVSEHTLWAWLRGDRTPRPAQLYRIAKVLDVPPHALVVDSRRAFDVLLSHYMRRMPCE